MEFDPERELAHGAEIWIEWGGRWWRGRVLHSLGGGRYRIHYHGWSARWDEDVMLARIAPGDRPPPGPVAAATTGGTMILVVLAIVVVVAAGAIAMSLQWTASSGPPASARAITSIADAPIGEPVWVEWNGSWYEGTVLSVSPTSGEVRVHYLRYSDGDDEDVTLDRLRTRE